MAVIEIKKLNDLYARDTSSKIKAVKLSTFKSGKYVGCYAPLGYRKSEADKHAVDAAPSERAERQRGAHQNATSGAERPSARGFRSWIS